MKKNQERLDHGLHNEKVCDLLDTKREFTDWIITTAFYTALQFVSYKIFPIDIKVNNGKKVTIIDIDQYRTLMGKREISKHKLLADLVNKHFPAIYEDYDWLLDASYNARYINYQHPVEVAILARSLMKKIKKTCV